jgi:hypothetical protein
MARLFSFPKKASTGGVVSFAPLNTPDDLMIIAGYALSAICFYHGVIQFHYFSFDPATR